MCIYICAQNRVHIHRSSQLFEVNYRKVLYTMSSEREPSEHLKCSAANRTLLLHCTPKRQAVTHQLIVEPCLSFTFSDLIIKFFSFFIKIFLLSSMLFQVNVSTMSGKRKRVVVSLNMKFRVIRALGYPRFPLLALSSIIGTMLYRVNRI